jgi:hypothetical protein
MPIFFFIYNMITQIIFWLTSILPNHPFYPFLHNNIFVFIPPMELFILNIIIGGVLIFVYKLLKESGKDKDVVKFKNITLIDFRGLSHSDKECTTFILYWSLLQLFPLTIIGALIAFSCLLVANSIKRLYNFYLQKLIDENK